MPPIFVGLPSTAEQIDSLSSFFDGIDGSPDIPDSASIAEVLVILSSHAHLVFSKSEKDIRAFFAEFCAFLQKLRDGDSKEFEIINNTTSAITKDTTNAILRLTLLNNLYNVFSVDSKFRCDLFLAILEYSVATDNIEIVLPVLPQVDPLLEQWNASNEQKQKIYKAVCDVQAKNDPTTIVYYQALKSYLATFESVEDRSVAVKQAVDAAVLAIKLQDVNQCDDLLELKAVEQLKTDNDNAKIYQLLELFTGQKLDSFDEFTSKNPEFLQSVGLSQTDCSNKMKLLSLATIASENRELPYSTVAETLKIDNDEVELLAISAISSGLIDAKIDQANSLILIRHCAPRVFNEEQWKQLQSKLNNWKANVKNMLASVNVEEEQKAEN